MDIARDWVKPNTVPDLKDGRVAVWRFDPRSQQANIGRFEALLSPGERSRLDHFVDQDSRRNFAVCRGVLHFLLARAGNIAGDQVQITNGVQGKPELDHDLHSSSIFFNISHTEGLCVIALSRQFEVGVDVEKIRWMKELKSMARSYLAPEEYTHWADKADGDRNQYFYECWCAKEAVLKAVGCGLTIHPGQINMIELLSGQPVRGVQEDGCLFEFQNCRLMPLPLADEFKGWLAVMGNPESIELYDFEHQVVR